MTRSPLAQTAPRTAWGDPDLQGTYTNKTTTPLQRPDNVGDREFLTEEEVANRERAHCRAELVDHAIDFRDRRALLGQELRFAAGEAEERFRQVQAAYEVRGG